MESVSDGRGIPRERGPEDGAGEWERTKREGGRGKLEG